MNVQFISPEERAKREQAARADKERKILDNDPALYIRRHTVTGHSFESHVAVSQTTLLNNVLSGQKLGDTAFRDEATQQYCIQEILYNSMQEIHDWVRTAKPGQRRIYVADFTDGDDNPDYIGSGYLSGAENKQGAGQSGVSYLESNIAGVVIKKNPDAPDGWEITTAYPMSYPTPELITEQTSIRMPEQNFKDLLHTTETYRQASPAKKIYLNANCSNNRPLGRYLIQYSPERDAAVLSDRKAIGAPKIKIDKNGNLAMVSRNRQSIDLNTKHNQQLAKNTIPELYQYAQNLTQPFQAADQKTGPNLGPAQAPAPTNSKPQARSLAGLTLVNAASLAASQEYD